MYKTSFYKEVIANLISTHIRNLLQTLNNIYHNNLRNQIMNTFTMNNVFINLNAINANNYGLGLCKIIDAHFLKTLKKIHNSLLNVTIFLLTKKKPPLYN